MNMITKDKGEPHCDLVHFTFCTYGLDLKENLQDCFAAQNKKRVMFFNPSYLLVISTQS